MPNSNTQKIKILIIDDDVDMCFLLDRFLTKHDYEVKTLHKGSSALEYLANNKVDLCICDFRLGDIDGIELIKSIRAIQADTKTLMITGYSDIKVAVQVIKMGAYDYITKPILPDELLATIQKALSSENTVTSQAKEKKENKSSNNKYITGNSKQAKELYSQIDLVAPTNYSVIIYGETGTGKESIARTIHERSNRKNNAFIAVDCGALSRELAASELFGHEKGAFTGALQAKAGMFEIANGGTLFLDEIANLPYDVQTLLLRAVQEQKIRRVGGVNDINVDVRIIVASNENLMEAVRAGKFREDLYHRFNQFDLSLSALRDRGKDIMLFAEFFLELANKELNKNILGFDEDVVNSFNTYPWPGNLRELNNVIKRACLLCDKSYIESKNLPQEISNNTQLFFSDRRATKTNDKKLDLKSAAAEAELETILSVLRQVQFNKTKAAKLLNIDRKTLYNKMKLLNLNTDDTDNE
jgi:two-component system response regulator HydG